jgi:hypothetical protein
VLKSLLSIFGTAVALYSGALYLWSIVRGPTRPHRVTWGGWTLAGILGLWASYEGGAGIGLLVTATFVIIVTLTFGLSLLPRYGVNGGSRYDYIAGGLAASGIIAWRIFDFSPETAATIAVVADAVFLWFTLHKAWQEPETEAIQPWVLGTVALLLGVVSLGDYGYAAAAFSVYILIGNILIVNALLIQRLRRQSNHTKERRK